MKLLYSLCLVLALFVTSASAQTVYIKAPGTYLLATNLASLPKLTTNTDNYLTIGTNTFLSALVPVPADHDLAIFPVLVPAVNSLCSNGTFTVAYNYSDGVTFTTTTDPLSITFSSNGSNTVAAYIRVNKTNFYGASYIIPDYATNPSTNAATLSIGYGLIYP